jgi:hypothetical protein
MRVCCRRVVITFQERRSLSDGEHEHQVEEQLRPADPLVRFTPPRQIAAGHLTRGLDRARGPSGRLRHRLGLVARSRTGNRLQGSIIPG